MSNNRFESWKEFHEWILSGKEVVYGDYIYKLHETKGIFNAELNDRLVLSEDLNHYTKHLEPEKPKQWYQVFYRLSGDNRPKASQSLYESKEDFFRYGVEQSRCEDVMLVEIKR